VKSTGASYNQRNTIMGILLCVSIAWVTFGLLFVGLGLIFLLIIEHASNKSQAMMAHERISDQAAQLVKRDLAVDEPVQQARELADAFDGLAQLEGLVTLAPRDAIPAAHRADPDRTQHKDAVIIRDPRLTRARTLNDQTGVGLTATSIFPTACGGRDTAA
jgi:hypothetical protein